MIPEKNKKYHIITTNFGFDTDYGMAEWTGMTSSFFGEVFYIMEMGRYEVGEFRESEIREIRLTED